MTVRLFLTGKSLPNYVEAVFASRRLPPKAAVSAYRRHSFVEGIRNGGLDFVKAAGCIGVSKNCCTTAFFLLPSSGRFYKSLFFLFNTRSRTNEKHRIAISTPILNDGVYMILSSCA